MENMFCYQCQEAMHNTGCFSHGVCGKDLKVAIAQDFLVWLTQGMAIITTQLREEGKEISKEVNDRINENLFSTVTNVNFNLAELQSYIDTTIVLKRSLLEDLITEVESASALWDSTDYTDWSRKLTQNEDIRSLQELILYGIKGVASYNHHANILGKYDDCLDASMQRILAATLDTSLSINDLLSLVMETGELGVSVMKLLDEANTGAYGHPEITKVNIGVGNKPGILITGHDLKDLEMLLEQTQGTGVDVYSHGEMLPAHYYPLFKKYKHFVGNYGNAWWKQDKEFSSFNGPILVTTNCLVPPRKDYKDRVYTTGVTGFSGCQHIQADADGKKDFSTMIAHAKKCNPPKEIEKGEIIGGFAHNQVVSLLDKIIEAVKSGAIKKFVVMAGCDGRHQSREYYSSFAAALPKDTVILTAGCAKYRYNKLDLGDIDGIPRVLDAGQCNDSYSLVLVALALKEAFDKKDINELPIIYNIAWYEQKAITVLLALLSLGVKNIHVGPTLPAFLTETVAKTLIEGFGIAGIQSVEEDMELFFGHALMNN